MKRYLLLLLFSCCVWKTEAQHTIDTLRFQQMTGYTSKLVPGVHKYVQYYTDSTGEVIRVNSLKTRIIKEDPTNKNITWIIQKYNTAKGVDMDTSFLNSKDFKPTAYRTQIQSGGYKEAVSFAKDSLFTNVYYKDSTVTTSYATNSDQFLATTFVDILSVLPFKVGYTTIIKYVNPGEHHGTADMKVQVVKKEKLKLSNESVTDAYLVESGAVGSKSFSQYWFSADKQVLLKHSFRLRNGTVFNEERLIL